MTALRWLQRRDAGLLVISTAIAPSFSGRKSCRLPALWVNAERHAPKAETCHFEKIYRQLRTDEAHRRWRETVCSNSKLAVSRLLTNSSRDSKLLRCHISIRELHRISEFVDYFKE
jgi:hypothetical protein